MAHVGRGCARDGTHATRACLAGECLPPRPPPAEAASRRGRARARTCTTQCEPASADDTPKVTGRTVAECLSALPATLAFS
eukprot:6521911-Prymnesium_polylepis.1